MPATTKVIPIFSFQLKNIDMINIIIEGQAQSGKSHVIALIGKYLKSLGCNVTIQSEETHNAGTLAMSDDEILKRLQSERIIIKEMRTS